MYVLGGLVNINTMTPSHGWRGGNFTVNTETGFIDGLINGVTFEFSNPNCDRHEVMSFDICQLTSSETHARISVTICLLSMGLALNTTMTTSEWTEYEVGQICGSWLQVCWD